MPVFEVTRSISTRVEAPDEIRAFNRAEEIFSDRADASWYETDIKQIEDEDEE